MVHICHCGFQTIAPYGVCPKCNTVFNTENGKEYIPMPKVNCGKCGGYKYHISLDDTQTEDKVLKIKCCSCGHEISIAMKKEEIQEGEKE
jgi:rRNA maturation endonuclease Nob1